MQAFVNTVDELVREFQTLPKLKGYGLQVTNTHIEDNILGLNHAQDVKVHGFELSNLYAVANYINQSQDDQAAEYSYLSLSVILSEREDEGSRLAVNLQYHRDGQVETLFRRIATVSEESLTPTVLGKLKMAVMGLVEVFHWTQDEEVLLKRYQTIDHWLLAGEVADPR